MTELFENRRELIASRTPFFGHWDHDLAFDWNDAIKLMDTHPDNMTLLNGDRFKISLRWFEYRGSPKFVQDIFYDIENTFNKNQTSIMMFNGFGKENKSYPWHCDVMDVFIFQAIGKMQINIEGVDGFTWMEPGDYVWIPRGVHHEVFPHKSRVTFSYGIHGDTEPSEYFLPL